VALTVRVPGPAALWSLTVDGVAYDVAAAVPVPPGRSLVRLDARVPLPRGDGALRVECAVDVPPAGDVVLTLPLADTPLDDLLDWAQRASGAS
jgi:hypothetical protein